MALGTPGGRQEGQVTPIEPATFIRPCMKATLGSRSPARTAAASARARVRVSVGLLSGPGRAPPSDGRPRRPASTRRHHRAPGDLDLDPCRQPGPLRCHRRPGPRSRRTTPPLSHLVTHHPLFVVSFGRWYRRTSVPDRAAQPGGRSAGEQVGLHLRRWAPGRSRDGPATVGPADQGQAVVVVGMDGAHDLGRQPEPERRLGIDLGGVGQQGIAAARRRSRRCRPSAVTVSAGICRPTACATARRTGDSRPSSSNFSWISRNRATENPV